MDITWAPDSAGSDSGWWIAAGRTPRLKRSFGTQGRTLDELRMMVLDVHQELEDELPADFELPDAIPLDTWCDRQGLEFEPPAAAPGPS